LQLSYCLFVQFRTYSESWEELTYTKLFTTHTTYALVVPVAWSLRVTSIPHKSHSASTKVPLSAMVA